MDEIGILGRIAETGVMGYMVGPIEDHRGHQRPAEQQIGENAGASSVVVHRPVRGIVQQVAEGALPVSDHQKRERHREPTVPGGGHR
jgi:hypothetical protein